MINRFKKILFFADGARGELAALRRAYTLAAHHGAQIVVMGVVEEVSTDDKRLQPSLNRIQRTIKSDKALELDKLIARVRAVDGRKPSVKRVVVPGKDYIEVIKQVQSGKFDLLVKSANSPTGVAALFGNTDLRLLHFCPCPVLILKPQRRKSLHNVLACVDPLVDSKAGVSLNKEIMDMAISVAELETIDLHLLHVLERPLAEQNVQGHKDALKELELSLKEDSQRKMSRLVEDYAHVPLTEHLIKGKPPTVISKFVSDQKIDLVVMGSVARSGIPGFIVGNTAEKILNQVDCSVLVLKPRGWKTPVK